MDTDRLCLMRGCQLAGARQMLAQAEAAMKQVATLTERTEFVSAALWCDMGEHSFSARDRKKVTYKIETTDEETGQPVEDTMTACGPCADKRKSMFQPGPAALPAGVDQEEYTRYLEWKNGITQQVPAAGL
jgi:hypothetical protein